MNLLNWKLIFLRVMPGILEAVRRSFVFLNTGQSTPLWLNTGQSTPLWLNALQIHEEFTSCFIFVENFYWFDSVLHAVSWSTNFEGVIVIPEVQILKGSM